MRVPGAGLCLTALVLTALIHTPALAVNPGDRLFVVVSPLEEPGPSAVVAFELRADGVPVQAESYPTGGNGHASYSSQGVVVDPGGRFLFVANNASDSIAVFVIEPDSTLEPVDGSPFPVGDPPSTYSPWFLAVSPETSFLYAATSGGLVVFEVADDGALDPIQSLQVSERGIATSPAGDYLYAAGWSTNAVDAYRVTASGTLVEIDGSPFGYDADRPAQVVVSTDGLRLWALDLDTGIAAFDIDDEGALHLSGQTDVGAFSDNLAAAEDRPFGGKTSYLYTSPPFEPEVRAFTVDGDAPVALPGSPFPAEYSGQELLVSTASLRLYQVTRQPANILPMRIALDGALSPLDFPVPVETDDGSVPNGGTYYGQGPVWAEIDVHPGSDPNPIRLRSYDEIPVAILGTDGYDVADVNQLAMRLGPAGALPVHELPHPLEDIDGDGDADVVLHFRTEETGIGCDDTTVDLTGRLHGTARREIRAKDAIEVLDCGKRPHRHCESEMRRSRR